MTTTTDTITTVAAMIHYVCAIEYLYPFARLTYFSTLVCADWLAIVAVAKYHRANGPLAIYVKLQLLQFSHASVMPGTFSPAPRVSDPDMHHGTCVTHVPWYIPWSLTSSFHSSRWQKKRSRHSRRMTNPQFYVSGKWHMSRRSTTIVLTRLLLGLAQTNTQRVTTIKQSVRG